MLNDITITEDDLARQEIAGDGGIGKVEMRRHEQEARGHEPPAAPPGTRAGQAPDKTPLGKAQAWDLGRISCRGSTP